jgi:hypothetical protein
MRKVLSDLPNVLEHEAENLIAVLAKESAKHARNPIRLALFTSNTMLIKILVIRRAQ